MLFRKSNLLLFRKKWGNVAHHTYKDTSNSNDASEHPRSSIGHLKYIGKSVKAFLKPSLIARKMTHVSQDHGLKD